MTTSIQSDVRNTLCDMQDALDSIDNPPIMPQSIRDLHNETMAGSILRAWERLAALTGNHDLALNQGFEMPQHLLDLPRRTPATPADHALRSAMLEAVQAADAINNSDDQEPNADTTLQHNREARTRLALAWQQMAVGTGNCRLALQEEPRQPIVPFRDLGPDPLRALGVASVHLEPALALYRAVQADPESPDNPDRLLQAQEEARLAYFVLWTIVQSMQDYQNDPRDHQVTAACQQSINRLNRHQQRAAHAMGLTPPQPRDLSVFAFE